MKNNYFDILNNKNYIIKDTYINCFEDNKSNQFLKLPEDYSIFTKIDEKYFNNTDTERNKFLSDFLRLLKSQIYFVYQKYDKQYIFPKLELSVDDDNAVILNWIFNSFRIYFDFEERVNNSYFGIIAQSDNDGIFMTTKKLKYENYKSIINESLKYVLENS